MSVCRNVNNSTFVNNSVTIQQAGSAQGGALIATYLVGVSQSTFIGNFAQALSEIVYGNANGGAVMSLNALSANSSTFEANSCLVMHNGGAQGAGMAGATMQISGCRFVRNSCSAPQPANGYAIGAAAYASSSIASDNSFYSSNTLFSLGEASGGALYSGTDLSDLNSIFAHNEARAGLNSFAVGGSVKAAFITFTNSTFSNSAAVSLGGVALGGSVSFSFSLHAINTTFSDSLSQSTGANAYGGAVAYEGFNGNLGGSTSLVELVNVACHSSVARTDNPNSFSFGGCIAAEALNATGLVVSNSSAEFGGAVYFESDEDTPSSLRHSTVSYSQASLGGAVYLVNSILTVSDSRFDTNSASEQGGALYVDNQSKLTVSGQNMFRFNSASAGGGIFWNNSIASATAPVVSASTVYQSNSAFYGNNIASFPVRLAVIQSGCTPPIPGCQLDTSSADLDYYDQPVVVSRDFLASVAMEFTLPCSASVSSTLDGWTNQSIHLFPSQSGQVFDGKLTAKVFLQRNWDYSTALYSKQPFSDCEMGSILTDLPNTPSVCLLCQSCSFGTYNLESNSDECLTCPTAQGQSQCIGSQIYAGTNWWLSVVNNTIVPNPCLSSFCSSNSTSACPSTTPIADCAVHFAQSQNFGLFAPGNTTYCDHSREEGKVSGWCEAMNFCASNRKGFMCGDCIDERYSEWNGECIDCSNPQYGYLALVIAGYWAEVLVLYMLLSGVASSGTKTLVYFVQVSLLILTPISPISVALSFINVRISTGSSTCLFQRTFFGEFLQNVFVLPAVMLVQLLISFGVYTVIMRSRGRSEQIDSIRWLVRPLTAVALALYTPVTSSVLSMLQCEEISGYFIVSAAPSYLCGGSAHFPYFIIAIVLAIVVVFGLPFVALILLCKYRTRVSDPTIKSKLGYWYEAYRPDVFWWEVSSLVRRTILTALSVSLSGAPRALAMSLVCAVVAGLHHIVSPNVDLVSNTSEYLSLLMLVLLTALNAGYFALTGDSQRVVAILQDAVVAVTAFALLCTAVYLSRVRLLLGVKSVAARVKLAMGKEEGVRQYLLDKETSEEIPSV